MEKNIRIILDFVNNQAKIKTVFSLGGMVKILQDRGQKGNDPESIIRIS